MFCEDLWQPQHKQEGFLVLWLTIRQKIARLWWMIVFEELLNSGIEVAHPTSFPRTEEKGPLLTLTWSLVLNGQNSPKKHEAKSLSDDNWLLARLPSRARNVNFHSWYKRFYQYHNNNYRVRHSGLCIVIDISFFKSVPRMLNNI